MDLTSVVPSEQLVRAISRPCLEKLCTRQQVRAALFTTQSLPVGGFGDKIPGETTSGAYECAAELWQLKN